jgi:hypothetical protein
MWPWGHAAVGYLLYSLYARQSQDRRPSGPAAIAVGVGTLLPDLIDKPLSWWLAVLPNGRSLTHSGLTAIALITILWVVTRRYEVEGTAVAFGIGYGSHLFADGFHSAISGEFEALAYLLWPVLPPIEYPTEQSFGAHLAQLSLTPMRGFELALTALALVVWYRDGTPGVGQLWRLLVTAPRRALS